MFIIEGMNIGKNIRMLRKRAGLTQTDLAKPLGIRQQAVADYERDKANPEAAKLPVLAECLQVEIGELFFPNGKEAEPEQKIKRKNSREVRMQGVFKQLSAEEQRAILKQMTFLAAKRTS